MPGKRSDEWENSADAYTPNQIDAVLQKCGIDIESDTVKHFLCYCPFHGNTDTPAFIVNKSTGNWYCLNPTCNQTGDLLALVRSRLKMNVFESYRLVHEAASYGGKTFSERLADALAVTPDFVQFSEETVARMQEQLPGSAGEKYMLNRGFEYDTLDYFGIGYSENKNMVTVPMHDPKGMLIGFVGRSADPNNKAFKNTVNLPKSLTAWNFHRAKKEGETVIVCEASFDAMRIHQAGFPNVIALLGGHASAHHLQQIERTFSTVVIMTDYDKKMYPPNCRVCGGRPDNCVGHRPGRDLGRSIARGLRNKKTLWAAYDDTCVYPHDAKDASDMTDAEIRQCIRSAISNLAYEQWEIDA